MRGVPGRLRYQTSGAWRPEIARVMMALTNHSLVTSMLHALTHLLVSGGEVGTIHSNRRGKLTEPWNTDRLRSKSQEEEMLCGVNLYVLGAKRSNTAFHHLAILRRRRCKQLPPYGSSPSQLHSEPRHPEAGWLTPACCTGLVWALHTNWLRSAAPDL